MNIFVTPDSCSKLDIVKYPHAKRPQEPQSYLYDEENLTLYEVAKFTDQYRSWFVDNLLCQDGHINYLTQINPLFIFLPELMNFAKDQFRTLHDICQTFSLTTASTSNFSRLDFALSPSIDWTKVCDTRDIDDELFVRFSESKTLDWLLVKHKQTVAALTKQQPTQTSRANIVLEASDLIEQYLPVSLAEKFKAQVRRVASASMNETDSDSKLDKISGGTKRVAPTSSSAVARGKAAASKHKSGSSSSTGHAEPPKSGGIMNFFKPVNNKR